MTRLVLLEGNTAAKRAGAAKLGVRNSSTIYAEAIASHFPDIALDIVNGADEDWSFPDGRGWTDYDGVVVTGSALHAYDTEFEVTNQIAMIADAADHGLPIFGSCWGLQIAVMAAGGLVEYNPRGREVGICRKIAPTDAGQGHPMFRHKPAVFDAPCIHYDEVTRLPEGATLLASNIHSKVQAALVPLGKSVVWAVQYHPEFDLRQLIQLYTLYADDMVKEGFFASQEDLADYVAKLETLDADPDNLALSWQLGIDRDILDDHCRNGEIIAWIEEEVLN
ncbi:type 1 glutamine amidotransferase [Croceicoccus sediminis]|uniref:type 1 glutamine amidotransferase n=1 Tax=Croceicoccus sediminis TaxID=2571150 RepID=UPI001181D179|nr:type 1 glutamine amidotransferase [Croceicoccus sediminis]